jgi:hypothetical protein
VIVNLFSFEFERTIYLCVVPLFYAPLLFELFLLTVWKFSWNASKICYWMSSFLHPKKFWFPWLEPEPKEPKRKFVGFYTDRFRKFVGFYADRFRRTKCRVQGGRNVRFAQGTTADAKEIFQPGEYIERERSVCSRRSCRCKAGFFNPPCGASRLL